jgi:hypothetical protein
MRPALRSVILTTLLVVACSLPMQLPDGLDGAQQLDITGFSTGIGKQWDHHFRIGSYDIADIALSGWTRRFHERIPFGSRRRSERSYFFAVRAQGRTLKASCTISLDETWRGRSRSVQHGLSCKCTEGHSLRAALELRMSEHERAPRWEADLGEVDINMWAVTESPRGFSEGGKALGYEVSSAKGVGAFEVRDEGRVFLPPKLDEDERLGALCSYGAVMLYEPIESD